MILDIEAIEAGTRLRGINAEQVQALQSSIAEVGLLSPITVYPRQVMRANISVDGYGLVAGLHRLEACRSLGLVEIEANVVSLGELERQIAECDENLCGAKLSPAERALFTRRRKDAYEALHPETRHGAIGNGREKSGNFCHSTFSADTASRTGQAERTVRLDATRGARIDDAVLADVAGSDLDKGTTLDALAAVPRDQQAAELQRLREAPRSKPVPTPKNELETEDDWRNGMMRLWNRAPDEWRERFIDYVQAPVFDNTRMGSQ
jgi:ParB family chromosome partitioning protein